MPTDTSEMAMKEVTGVEVRGSCGLCGVVVEGRGTRHNSPSRAASYRVRGPGEVRAAVRSITGEDI